MRFLDMTRYIFEREFISRDTWCSGCGQNIAEDEDGVGYYHDEDVWCRSCFNDWADQARMHTVPEWVMECQALSQHSSGQYLRWNWHSRSQCMSVQASGWHSRSQCISVSSGYGHSSAQCNRPRRHSGPSAVQCRTTSKV